MACKVRYLNSAGIMPREIRGIETLANAFPSEWLLYVSLNCFPRNQQSMEIDAVVVTDQCVLLLEIKDWNGKLTQRGDLWYVGKANRGRSAVIQVSEKAKKLKTVLLGELGNALSVKLWVEARVVLTGSSDKSHIPANEAQFIWSLEEARSLGEPSRRKSLLPNGTLTFFKLYQLETEFDQVLGNAKLFQPLEADWGGYQVVERDIFMHPRGIWQDHRGARRDESRLKAMVRTWSFDKLPPGLNSLATRRTVAQRETRAFAYPEALHVRDRRRELQPVGSFLKDLLQRTHDLVDAFCGKSSFGASTRLFGEGRAERKYVSFGDGADDFFAEVRVAPTTLTGRSGSDGADTARLPILGDRASTGSAPTLPK